MCKKLICLVSFVLVLGLALTSAAGAADLVDRDDAGEFDRRGDGHLHACGEPGAIVGAAVIAGASIPAGLR